MVTAKAPLRRGFVVSGITTWQVRFARQQCARCNQGEIGGRPESLSLRLPTDLDRDDHVCRERAGLTNIVSGLTALVFGGYILMMFGNVVLQSLRDKRVRDDLLSDPHVRNPTRFHKMAFTALAALLLVFALLLIDERASPSDMDMRSIAQASAHLVTATPMESLSKPEPLQQLYQVWVSQGTPPA